MRAPRTHLPGAAAVTHTGAVISLELALRLQQAGVRWTPQEGDRFSVPGKDLDTVVFVVSTMVVDVVGAAGRRLIRFNGTVEWALDSIEQDEVVWLPAEDQLRGLLGGAFRGLAPLDGGFRVDLEVAGLAHQVHDAQAAEAYGRALLLLATGTDDDPSTLAP